MGHYLDKDGNYYQGDRVGNDPEVLQRPSRFHTWNGSAWTDDGNLCVKAEALAELVEMEKVELMPRVTREFLITATLIQAAQLGISQASILDPLDPAFSPGFKKMWDFNQKTIELRKKL